MSNFVYLSFVRSLVCLFPFSCIFAGHKRICVVKCKRDERVSVGVCVGPNSIATHFDLLMDFVRALVANGERCNTQQFLDAFFFSSGLKLHKMLRFAESHELFLLSPI